MFAALNNQPLQKVSQKFVMAAVGISLLLALTLTAGQSNAGAKGVPSKTAWQNLVASYLHKNSALVFTSVNCAMPKTWKKGTTFICSLIGIGGGPNSVVGRYRMTVTADGGATFTWLG